jgi:ferredoxin
MLVINPDECIDFGVCVPECLAEAIVSDNEPAAERSWLELNRHYSAEWPNTFCTLTSGEGHANAPNDGRCCARRESDVRSSRSFHGELEFRGPQFRASVADAHSAIFCATAAFPDRDHGAVILAPLDLCQRKFVGALMPLTFRKAGAITTHHY